MIPNRRDFLKTSMVAWGLTVPGFVCRTALAAPSADNAGAKDTILVVVQLTGGNDGLNTVIPLDDPLYTKYRPTLKIGKDQLKKLDDNVGLHPQLGELAKLHDDQALGVIQGVGYPNPNQSHFRSMDIWQAASTAETLTEGWIGKALKALPQAASFHLAANNESSPLALTGAPVRVPSITSLADFQLKTIDGNTAGKGERSLIEAVSQPGTGNPGLLDFVRRTAVNTYESSKRLQEIAKNYQPKVNYPPFALANRLKLAAQLIAADLGARLFYVSIDGFDTHANQAAAHPQLLLEVANSISAFYKDMAAQGHKDRIAIMTFSEFGRRAKENGSRGTDHGSAAPMFLVGGKVKPGVIGAHPNLEKLEDGNLKHHTDFRQVYASVLDQWLGVRSKDVLGQEYKALDLFKS
ncbi:hypothetical protein AYO44_02445 [Planctomycetaceae bacterium SCGC AG-212-F19]|nr:hypothetical protein AYO44_02445 [Planctomycetaceae bacterium SCGC AG-212-F19]